LVLRWPVNSTSFRSKPKESEARDGADHQDSQGIKKTLSMSIEFRLSGIAGRETGSHPG